jgi:hypothetical protein
MFQHDHASFAGAVVTPTEEAEDFSYQAPLASASRSSIYPQP